MVEPICDLPPLSESLRDSESHLNVHSRGHAGPHGGVWVGLVTGFIWYDD